MLLSYTAAAAPRFGCEGRSPIAHGCRAHRSKPTKLLNFDVIGSGGLHGRVERLSLYQLLAGLTTGLGSGLTLLARYAPAGAGSLACGY